MTQILYVPGDDRRVDKARVINCRQSTIGEPVAIGRQHLLPSPGH